MGLLNDDREALFGVPGQGQILLTETQRSPYTSFVTLVGLDRAEWLQVPQPDVRMYHDARMAEIASIDGCKPVAGSHCRLAASGTRMKSSRSTPTWVSGCDIV